MEFEFIQLVVANIPNYLGFVMLAVILTKTLNRVLDLIERCIDDDE